MSPHTGVVASTATRPQHSVHFHTVARLACAIAVSVLRYIDCNPVLCALGVLCAAAGWCRVKEAWAGLVSSCRCALHSERDGAAAASVTRATCLNAERVVRARCAACARRLCGAGYVRGGAGGSADASRPTDRRREAFPGDDTPRSAASLRTMAWHPPVTDCTNHNAAWATESYSKCVIVISVLCSRYVEFRAIKVRVGLANAVTR